MSVLTKDQVLVPVAYEQLSITTAKGLTSATYGDATRALIIAEDQNVRWRDDGTDPTTAIGMLLAAGKDFMYVGDLSTIKFIAVTGTAELNVSYYN